MGYGEFQAPGGEHLSSLYFFLGFHVLLLVNCMMLHENIHHALQQLSLQFLPAFKLKTFHIRDSYLLLINSCFVIYYYSSDPGPACSVTALLTKLTQAVDHKIQPDPVDHAPFFFPCGQTIYKIRPATGTELGREKES